MKSSASRTPRRLIVNADDFGLSTGVNAGVVEAFSHGILTSATLLANAPAFDEAARLAREHPGLGVGLHLNLVRGAPLSRPDSIPELVDGDGRFRRFRLRRMSGPFLEQAEAEYRRQFEKAAAAGIVPTHVDFEKHHAWQKPLYLLACRLAAEYGVGAVRWLREPVAWSVGTLGWPGLGKAAQAALLRCGLDLGGRRRTGILHPDRLLGQCHIGGMTEAIWLRLAANVPAGTSEVMTHPGRAEDGAATAAAMGGSWLEAMRRVELAALLSPDVRAALENSGVELIHYGRLREFFSEGD